MKKQEKIVWIIQVMSYPHFALACDRTFEKLWEARAEIKQFPVFYEDCKPVRCVVSPLTTKKK